MGEVEIREYKGGGKVWMTNGHRRKLGRVFSNIRGTGRVGKKQNRRNFGRGVYPQYQHHGPATGKEKGVCKRW